jgi:hypothetical protein
MYNRKDSGKRVLLHVKRWRQHPSECAIASASSLAGYFDGDITYEDVRLLVPPSQRPQGLYTSQQARLLNQLGFDKVSIVSADEDILDFTWARLSKHKLIEKLKKKRAFLTQKATDDSREAVSDMVKWLEDDRYENNLVVSYDFPKFIRHQLDHGRPVGASFNWTKIWKQRKAGAYADIGGHMEQHAVVIRGYDEDGVFVVDSHHRQYTGKLKRYRNGYYKLPWEKYLVSAAQGDLILVYP